MYFTFGLPLGLTYSTPRPELFLLLYQYRINIFLVYMLPTNYKPARCRNMNSFE